MISAITGKAQDVAHALPQLSLNRRPVGQRQPSRGRVRHALAPGTARLPASESQVALEVLAAFAGVLARYGRSAAVTFGCVIQEHGLLGLRVEVDSTVDLAHWSDRVRNALASAASREDGGQSLVAEHLGVQPDKVPEFLQRAVFLVDPPRVLGDAPAHEGQLVAWVETSAAQSELVVDFDAALLDVATVERFAARVAVLMARSQRTPSVPLSAVPLLSDAEQERLAGFNATGVDYPRDVTLASLFAAQVAATPDAPAVTGHDGATLTYAQLDGRTNQLARWLREHGVTSDSPVGVFAHRGIDMVAAIYGIIKAGGAYVPLDPDYPDDRLRFMIDEAAVPVVLTQSHLQDRISAVVADGAAGPVTLALDTDADWQDRSAQRLPDGPDPDHLAYVIYTSGSTGRPKGVANTHRGICNRLLWMQDAYRLDASDRVLQKTPFSFDVSVWEFFWPLQVGAHLVIAAPGGHRDAGYLVETITRHQITTVHFVPSMLRLLLEHDGARGDELTSLRRVICSGEALTSDLRDRFFDRFSCELHNLYGPTEAAVDVTAWQCRPDETDPVVPIGRPIANTTIHILDEHGHPTPIGVPGELHIGGVQVARGYIARPDLTAERFILDPFDSDPNARLYKTGDLARWLPDGTIDFLGRLDFQVKMHGVRIELGEIEAALGAHPNVRDATVVLHTDDRGHQRLVAHIAQRSGHTPPTQLHDYLATSLPEHMVPRVFVTHDALPLTTSGKVDRNALAAQPLPGADHGDRDPPRTPVERFVADAWAEILGLPSVGVHQLFFDLGGNSLQAAEFVNRMQRELGAFIYVVTVFSAPTVADYARLLEREYSDAVRRRFGLPQSSVRMTVSAAPRLDETVLARLQQAVPSFAPFTTWNDGSPNPPAAFILSPPRSGTTLLRVMLAGHTKIFAAPELQLLCFDTLEQRQRAFSGRFSAWLEGTIRAVMELERCDADRARERIETLRRQGATAKEMYRQLQGQAGDRLLIDKSPSYALDPAVLRNAEDGFATPVYVHLVRDPVSMIRSFENYHMDQILWLDGHDLPPRLLAEAVWTLSHRVIVDFLATVPARRQIRVRFEDLVADPERVLRSIAATLDVAFEEVLTDPYANLGEKMVDGIYDASTPMGDTRLLKRHRIDPTAASRWRDDTDQPELGGPTVELARALGYKDVPTSRRPSDPGARHRFAAQSRARRARSRRTS